MKELLTLLTQVRTPIASCDLPYRSINDLLFNHNSDVTGPDGASGKSRSLARLQEKRVDRSYRAAD
jgi:hypothetical protein